MKKPKIITPILLSYYIEKQPITILKHYNKLKDKKNTDLNFYNTISAVYSSLIEGSRLLVSDYMKIHTSNMNRNNKDYKQVNDLINAYKLAQSKKLTSKNFLETHKIATQSLITQSKYRGNYRDQEVGVYNQLGTKVYTGCPHKKVATEMKLFFNDIEMLICSDLTYNQIFYFASMIHLVFVKIHPFADGNGRAARLLEKWFLATVLGKDAWKIQSEKLYHTRLKSYYKNLEIGIDYENVNYNASFYFLKMLPMALRIK